MNAIQQFWFWFNNIRIQIMSTLGHLVLSSEHGTLENMKEETKVHSHFSSMILVEYLMSLLW